MNPPFLGFIIPLSTNKVQIAIFFTFLYLKLLQNLPHHRKEKQQEETIIPVTGHQSPLTFHSMNLDLVTEERDHHETGLGLIGRG